LNFASIFPWTSDPYHKKNIEVKFQDKRTSGSVTISIKKTKLHENEAYLRTGKLTRALFNLKTEVKNF